MRSGYWASLVGISAANVLFVAPLAAFLGFLVVPQSVSDEAFSVVFHASGLAAALVAGLLVGLLTWPLLARLFPSRVAGTKGIVVISLTLQCGLAAAAWNVLSIGVFLFYTPIMCGGLLLGAASVASPFVASWWLRGKSSSKAPGLE